MSKHPIRGLTDLGQSVWYDFIKRDLLTSGKLANLIEEDSLRGMTSNPTIFEKAIRGGDLYDGAIRNLAPRFHVKEQIFEELAVEDVRQACDIFSGVYESTGGADGFVSIEVSPTLAHDTATTIAEAKRLWSSVGRANVMVKIPGTVEGLPAIEDCLASGLNINVTLLFSVERHDQVIEAYFRALEKRVKEEKPIDRISSVASFFVSRVDTAVDKKLKENGTPEAAALCGKIAIANAQLAYDLFERRFRGPRWDVLASKGARVQRPLWASTGTKDPSLSDVYYVEALAAPNTVNTLPPETFTAYKDHGDPKVRVQDGMDEAKAKIDSLARLGVDFGAILKELEDDGVKKFADSFAELLAAVEKKKDALGASTRPS